MKPLSEAFMDLAARAKRLEDSAAILREQKGAALQARCEQLEAAIDREVEEVEQTAAEARAVAQSWWLDTKASLERQFKVMRTEFKKWRTELVDKDAEGSAWDAEYDAVAAMTLASYCLDAAEWAALRAGLIRAEADERSRVAGRG
jgi:predicted transcriptional regulator